MPPQLLDRFKSAGTSISAMSLGQKVIAVIGIAVLVLGATAFGKWVSTPNLVPLASNLSGEDGTAITAILDQDGVKYDVVDGGRTIMVPQENKDAELLKLAGAGLPSSKDSSSLFASSNFTQSQFMEKANFQRAMEKDLAQTIQGIDGVRTAVVHIAVPEDTVFTDEKGKTTASVLVDTTPGKTLTDEQIQVILNLVASSVPNLDPTEITVSDSTGRLLSAAGQGLTGSGSTDARTQQYEKDKAAAIQGVLDKVLGPGKAIASVSAELNFDTTNEVEENFSYPKDIPPLSETKQTEKYTGTNGQTGGALGNNGVLGLDGTTTNPGGAGAGTGYEKDSSTVNNPIDKKTTTRQLAPGSVKRQSIAVVVDEAAAKNMTAPQLQETIANAAGVQDARGDTLSVTQATFDTSVAQSAAADLKAAEAEEAKAAQFKLISQGAIALLVLIGLIVIFIAMRRAAKRRPARETLDLGELERLYPAGPVVGPDGMALPAAGGPQLTPATPDPAALRRAEVGELVDQQPAEVADLLRGWLADSRKA
ncbi:flagellar M-ring protein FliF [Quadrisphaera granulorum]|uniref:Flagellar M-ring protein n=1 Tax=Quadrisphaera granulorum TaxID=317664 RepID=A0A316A4I7_9ACTN|nr:flagellar basal-body MS-ring/collar protein FliF [Quadrisphaera granulorum]PWJ52595.1 flagellar M-ring protein FliF [Quadrisphaera granulorum]SZE97645.1 flagellar M-ring protein FliF [Quadrisphaera granulorum]